MTGSITAPAPASITAPVSVGGSITVPANVPRSNMFSGYTATPLMPASMYQLGSGPGPSPLAAAVAPFASGTTTMAGTTYHGAPYYGTTHIGSSYSGGYTMGAPISSSSAAPVTYSSAAPVS